MTAPPATPRREDILVSVCLPEFTTGDTDALTALADRLTARYRYWELLVVVDVAEADAHDPLLQAVANLRLLTVRGAAGLYRRRAIAAAEAIGDVIVLTTATELPGLDVCTMIDTAQATDSVVIGERPAPPGLLDPAITALGRLSGFRVTLRLLQTTAYPRTLLNRLLAQPERALALRFPPRDAGLPVIAFPATGQAPARRSLGELGRRLGLIQKLLINAAPSVLSAVALLSVLVVLGGIAFALYAVGALFVVDTLQPGWFTTSLALSLTAAFLGVAIFGLTTGLQKALEALTPPGSDDVLGERSAVDLFGQVRDELNVEIGTLPAPDAPPAPAADPDPTARSAP